MTETEVEIRGENQGFDAASRIAGGAGHPRGQAKPDPAASRSRREIGSGREFRRAKRSQSNREENRSSTIRQPHALGGLAEGCSLQGDLARRGVEAGASRIHPTALPVSGSNQTRAPRSMSSGTCIPSSTAVDADHRATRVRPASSSRAIRSKPWNSTRRTIAVIVGPVDEPAAASSRSAIRIASGRNPRSSRRPVAGIDCRGRTGESAGSFQVIESPSLAGSAVARIVTASGLELGSWIK